MKQFIQKKTYKILSADLKKVDSYNFVQQVPKCANSEWKFKDGRLKSLSTRRQLKVVKETINTKIKVKRPSFIPARLNNQTYEINIAHSDILYKYAQGRIWEGEAEGQGEGEESLGPHLPDALRCLHTVMNQGAY